MDYEKLLIKIAKIFEDLKIDYFVTGSFAVSVWGRPRATFDIDIIVKMIQPQVESLVKALRKISKAGYIDENAAKEAIKLKGEFNFIDPNSGLKVDFWIAKKEESSLLEFKRKKCKNIKGQKVYFVSPEDLILSKLKWYKISPSDRHLEDAKSVLKSSGERMDRKYLKTQIRKLELSGLWQQLMK